MILQGGHSHFSIIMDCQRKVENCKGKRAGQKLAPDIKEEWARCPVCFLVPNLYPVARHSFFNVSSYQTFKDKTKTIDFADISLLLQVSEECVLRFHSNY